MKLVSTLFAVVAAAVSLSPSIASAGGPPPLVPPPIHTSLFASGDGPENATYDTLNNHGHVPAVPPLSAGDISTSAFVFYSGGSMTTSVSAFSSGGPLEGQAESDGQFYFELAGPAGLVPIDFDATGTTSVTGPGGTASAVAKVEFGSLAKLVACSDSFGGCGSFGPTFSGAVHFDVSPGHAYSVELSTDCNAASSMTHDTTCSAMIDPMISIDPGFAGAGLYTLSFSEDVASPPGPRPGIPEPSSWAIMLLGFLGVGATLRKRSRVVA